ncbi:MAG TPA: hypothetical protein VN894_03435 [Polyangiaceae bacterium]|nr:hypothetical protein [Polyangiaceae bacterium]
MRGGPIALLSLVGVTALAGCTRSVTGPPPSSVRYGEPRWQGVFEPTPELLVVVRPQALRRDAVYGPLVGRAMELAREHTPLVAATGALDAMEDAEEVIIGARDSNGEEAGDLVVVVRGVRANVDPAKIVDEGGHALWAQGPSASAAGVRELVRTREAESQGPPDPGAAPEASLFELPGRTWAIATGRARAHARDAFNRPAAGVDGDPLGMPSSALAVLRLSGVGLVARVRALRPPGLLAPLGSKLVALTVVLTPGDGAVVRATLSYNDELAVTPAEATLRQAIEALCRAKPDDYAWLRSVTVQASRCCVVVTAPLPRELMNREGVSPAISGGAVKPPSPTSRGATLKIPL